MQTIHIDVNDNYLNQVINILESLKGIMLEDIKIEKKNVDENKDLIKAQIKSMSKTWDNKEDEAWDEL
jgi:copper chaperone CopZ